MEEHFPVISGQLYLYLVRDPINWDRKFNGGDRNLDLFFNGNEWEALFFEVLHCPEVGLVRGETYEQYYQRARIIFRQALPQYPLLSRICDLYEDVGYTPTEIEQLQDECINIQKITSNTEALKGLKTIILACGEALKSGMGLLFASD